MVPQLVPLITLKVLQLLAWLLDLFPLSVCYSLFFTLFPLIIVLVWAVAIAMIVRYVNMVFGGTGCPETCTGSIATTFCTSRGSSVTLTDCTNTGSLGVIVTCSDGCVATYTSFGNICVMPFC